MSDSNSLAHKLDLVVLSISRVRVFAIICCRPIFSIPHAGRRLEGTGAAIFAAEQQGHGCGYIETIIGPLSMELKSLCA